MTPNPRILKSLTAVTAALVLTAAAPAPTLTLKTSELGHGPVVVMVHELGASGSVWMPVAERLAKHHRVVLVDLPGHGGSAMPDSFTLEQAVAALDHALQQQPADSTVLVGHGTGGLISLLAAGAHPERIRGIVVVNAASRSPTQMTPDQRESYNHFIEMNGAALATAMFTRMGSDSLQGDSLRRMASQVPGPVMKAYLKALFLANAYEEVKRINAPLLFVGGVKAWPADKGWKEIAVDRGYELAPNASGVRMGSAGHYIPLDRPDSLAMAIAAFTDQVLAAKPRTQGKPPAGR